MITVIAASCRKIILMMILIGAIQLIGDENSAMAQLPDCVTGTVMYGVFSPSNPPVAGSDSTEIRLINHATGASWCIDGWKKVFYQKQLGEVPSVLWNCFIGLDPLSHRFFMMTQMGGGGSELGRRISSLLMLPLPQQQSTNRYNRAAYNDYHFVKMAITPTGIAK
jgi:hypothetical protein